MFVFFATLDMFRQASTGFDRRRAHLTPPSSRENSLTEIVLRHCVSIFVLETLLFLVIPLLRIIRTYFLLNLSFLLLLLNKYAIIIMLGNPLRLNNSLLSIRLFEDYSAN